MSKAILGRNPHQDHIDVKAMNQESSRISPEQRFWQWFQENESNLFDFERDQERMFDRLITEMHRVNPNLTFEFGPKRNGKREFVISADGIRDAFPDVKSLYDCAPALERWTFVKFRPRREPNSISLGGTSVAAPSVRVYMELNRRKVDLIVFVPNYSTKAHKTYASIVFLLLDEALGEYDVETRVGNIDIESTVDMRPESCTLQELPAAFDRLFPKH